MAKKEKKEKKAKKKGTFWLVLLIIILTGVAVYFGVRGVKKLLSNWMDGLLSDSPFVFETGDYYAYVTHDFTFDTEVHDAKGKVYALSWKSDSDAIVLTDDGKATITRPSDKNSDVTLTATAKWLFLKANRDYTLTVIRTASLKPAEVHVPTADELKSGSGHYQYTVAYDNSNTPFLVDGKLNVSVYSFEDAEAVAEAYRAFFKVPSSITFKCDTVNNEADGRHFVVSMYYCDAVVMGYTLTVSTNKTGTLTSVGGAAPTSLPKKATLITGSSLESRIKKAYGNDITIAEYNLCVEGTQFIWYVVCNIDDTFYNVSVNAVTGAVISRTMLGQNLTLSTTDSRGNKLNVTVDDPSIFGTLSDSLRKIYVYKYKHEEDSNGYKKEIEKENSSSSSSDEPDNGIVLYDSTVSPFEEWLIIHVLKSDYNRLKVSDATGSDVQAVTALYNVQKVYDWYKDLGYISADGKGTEINILTHSPLSENNASCLGLKNGPVIVFITGRGIDGYVGAACEHLDVMAHEFTHARFAQYNKYIAGSNTELSAMNEAYADIFGCFVEGNWEMAEGWAQGDALRNVSTMTYHNGITCPSNYLDIDFDKMDCHYSCMLLSCCAYEMEAIANVTREQNIELWYKAITYGLTNKATFVTMRAFIEIAARTLGYDKELIKAIGNVFGAHGIGACTLEEVQNDTVPGDELLDDTVVRRFVVLGSPIGSVLFKTPTLVMNNNFDLLKNQGGRTENEISDLLSNAFGFPIHYERSTNSAQDLLLRFFKNTKKTLSDKIGDTPTWTSYLFMCSVYECTAYEFVTKVLEIDPSLLK